MDSPDEPLTRLTARFEDALAFAAHLHAGQRRKGSGTPYVAHLIGVCALVLEHGGDEDQAIAGLLHDAVEDQGGLPTLELIRERYGPEVARIVEACTDADTVPKPAWRPRKERYLGHLRESDARVKLVSCADKLYNARTILSDYRGLGEALWPRFTASREETLWYYRALVAIFLPAGGGPLAEELARVVSELEGLLAGRT